VRRCSGEQRPQPICVRIREGAGFDLEAVVPVTFLGTLEEIALDTESSRLPLFDDVAIFVEHQPGVVEEIRGTAAQVDPPATRGGDGTAMKADEQGVLENADVVNRTVEEHRQRSAYGLGYGDGASNPGHSAEV